MFRHTMSKGSFVKRDRRLGGIPMFWFGCSSGWQCHECTYETEGERIPAFVF